MATVMQLKKLLKSFMRKKKIKNKQPKICIVSLTFDRPEYIERSFESIYKRAGMPFSHYVFDDNSNNQTKKKLRELKKKYKFKLFLNKETVGIYKRFYLSYFKIPKHYDYYVKLDSDVEILSDNFFPEMLKTFEYKKEKLSGIIPRVEGIKGFDRYIAKPDFFNGHTLKVCNLILSGCCMIFSKEVFTTIKEYSTEKIMSFEEKWGIDSVLLDEALKKGSFAIVDDLSVYHIDNSYGQRRKYPEYFTSRKRWVKIDNDEVWYILASEKIFPDFIKREDYERIIKKSSSFEDFIIKCKYFIKTKGLIENKKEEKKEKVEDKIITNKKNKNMPKVEMYKVTSPKNFIPCEYIPHGESKYFKEVPSWARNNPSLVIEKTKVFVASTTSKTTEKVEEKAKQKGKKVRKCKECGYVTDSLKRMKTHVEKKHSIIKKR